MWSQWNPAVEHFNVLVLGLVGREGIGGVGAFVERRPFKRDRLAHRDQDLEFDETIVRFD